MFPAFHSPLALEDELDASDITFEIGEFPAPLYPHSWFFPDQPDTLDTTGEPLVWPYETMSFIQDHMQY